MSLMSSIRESLAARSVDKQERIRTALTDPRVYNIGRWQTFLERCFVPKVFFDIGANDPFSREGQQTVFKPLMPATRFFLFEAMAKHEPALVRSGEPYAICVLDGQDGQEKTFYESKVYAPGTGDSVYLERTSAYAPDALIATKHITQRLDTLVGARLWPWPDFIKLDTQGSELDILAGASECLAHARGLQIECNVQRYNEGAPLLDEVVAFARDRGFRLYDIAQFHYNKHRELLQLDAIFVRADLVHDD